MLFHTPTVIVAPKMKELFLIEFYVLFRFSLPDQKTTRGHFLKSSKKIFSAGQNVHGERQKRSP